MKIANKILAIIPLLVGLGATTSAFANTEDLNASLHKALEKQTQQVTQSIESKLQQSYQADITAMAKQAAAQWSDKQQVIASINLTNIENTKTK
ncbi:hypothetical protein GCM10011501_31390 [Thalassotalea profundi]|uniref:Uncharacterized protein n=2 Tax=Thalassotalea profundi TaxID=2036687 RepID=A0ABQ3IZV0_9GAMM|nr:hypothetical protein GCM10011501_31390 [Thalassotalea profundi]